MSRRKGQNPEVRVGGRADGKKYYFLLDRCTGTGRKKASNRSGKALGLPQGGLHAFRRGCNRRWELAGIKPAVIRQQMGHSSERMTSLCSGEIPLDQVRAAFSGKLLGKMENEAAA
jgi:integrase